MTDLPKRRLSAFYACYFAVLGMIIPYWGLYLKEQGFTAGEIGQLSALIITSKIVAPYFWGWLADKTGHRLRLIRITTFYSALVFTGFTYQQDFIWFAFITLGFSFFWNATLPQFEAVTLLFLNRELHRYNRIRLWGSIGFIFAVLTLGQWFDTISIGYLPDIIIAAMLLNWLVALITPEAANIKKHTENTSLKQIIVKPEVWAFFLVCLLLQISHGPYYTFYSVYLQQHQYSASLTGFFWALGVIAEIVLFLFAGRLLNYLSLRSVLLISLALSTVRWLIIAYFIDYLALLVLAQCLHAASFGLAHIAAIQYLRQYFGNQLQGQAQALYSSVSFGIGGMVGSLYSGYYWQSLGGSTVFAIAATACALAWLITLFTIGKSAKPPKTA